MNTRNWRLAASGILLFVTATVGHFATAASPAAAAPNAPVQRLIVEAKSAADYAPLRAALTSAGAKVVIDLREVNLMVITTADGNVKSLALANAHTASVAPDRVEHLIQSTVPGEFAGQTGGAPPKQTRVVIQGNGPAAKAGTQPAVVTPDPAFSLPHLLWNADFVRAPQAWQQPGGLGYQNIKVGVADTGLDYTHAELARKVDSVMDFTLNEQPPICATSDATLAQQMGAPSSNLDFNGHGSWIGGNIAAAMDGQGINGLAPGVQLVALKISQNCGSAYDSEILDAFTYAANNGIDIVSISFGGYLDRTVADQDLIYRHYVSVVNYARSHGTTIAASAGNEHTRIGAGGQVLSHGILTAPPGGTDYFGLWENPGGIPGVIDVAADGRVVEPPSANCPADALAAGGFAWCKPTSDTHQSFGAGQASMLAYYSNYGPRIDFIAPGGARKFNLPVWDRGGTPGWPYIGVNSVYGGSSQKEGHNAWEAFSITSNWAVSITCFTFTGMPQFPDNQCYAIIQGTSMATPHVSAIAALAVSTHPEARWNPGAIYTLLQHGARQPSPNTTPPVSASDTRAADLTGQACTLGYCHLGGAAIPNSEAYGHGRVDALNTVTEP